jgi:hypothetical protein
MHAGPKPLFHRDIRWQNIIRSASTRTKWFLVDWDDASTPPTKAAMHLNQNTHAPAVFEDNHGAEVDIWGTGKLIIDAALFALDIPAAMITVGQRMVAGDIVTANQAHEELATCVLVPS